MKPLLILLGSFCFVLLIIRYQKGHLAYAKSAQVAMAIMLTFTAIGHVVFAKGMAMMLPNFVPMKIWVIYGTGLLELLFALGLLFPNIQQKVAYLLILFFILLLPANIKAALENINYQTGTFDGHGLAYLWFRIPLQIFFILWVYFAVLKNPLPSSQ